MTATAKTEVVGVRDALRSLNKIEPGLRKEFTRQAADIAKPAIVEAQNNYPPTILSGMARKWTNRGRQVFPWSQAKARRGVKLKIDARRDAVAVINIQQTDPGTAIFETAGRANPNSLGQALGPLQPNHTRILGPSVFRKRRAIEDEMRRLALNAVEQVNRELR